ncbi:MAG: hypothetical protein JW818_09890 [Pirellulales bacterium]|nr:hypothetical protein [Pirellulales bacterium]
MPLDKSFARPQTQRKIRELLANGVPAAAKQQFEDYFVKYEIARWTHKENFPQLPKLRRDLHMDLQTTRGGPAHKTLLDLIQKQMLQIIQGNYAPPARFNAMLMLGELDVTPAKTIRSAKPLPAMIPIMLGALDDPKLIDAVRVAALKGLLRHAELGIAPQDRDNVTKAMLKLATTTVGPSQRNPRGHDWMRCQALECLGKLGSAGPNGQVAKTLLNVLDEAGASLAVRCAAAQAIGDLKLKVSDGFKQADVADMVARLTRLARDVHKEELQKTKDDNRALNPAVLKSQFADIHIALTGTDRVTSHNITGGITPLATALKAEEPVNKLREKIKTWLSLLDDKTLTPELGRDPGMGPEFGPMGMPPMGMPPGGMAEGAETPAQVASKKILDEIGKDLVDLLAATASTKPPAAPAEPAEPATQEPKAP